MTRGLAMYESLKKHSSGFHLYIFAFDDISDGILREMKLEYATVVSLKEFEDEELLALKNSRSAGEYCWTCTPSIIKYSIEKFNLESCTYLDADLYFFSNPSVLIEEMGEKSVLITEHRYTPKYNQSATSGIYCVQFMTFKNDVGAMKVLGWWRESCNAWCFARFENGKFGDQKYLDDWTTRFEGVHELQHLGGGIAPWNVQQFTFDKLTPTITMSTHNGQTNFEVIFYHFHALKFYNDKTLDLGNYKYSKEILNIIYKPYINSLIQLQNELLNTGYSIPKYDKVRPKYKPFLLSKLKLLKRIIMGINNTYKLDYFIK